jgi:hypothetical protein
MSGFDFTEVFDNGLSEQGQPQYSELVNIASNLRTGTNLAYGISDFTQMYPQFLNPDKSGTTTLACTTTVGSSTITLTSTATIDIGQIVTGVGIPDVSYVVSIADSTHFVISNNVATSGTSISIYTPIVPVFMVNMYIGLANNCIRQARWRSYWVAGMGWFIAHFLTLYLQSITSATSPASKVIAAGQARGLTTSKSVGDVSGGYDYNLIGQDLNGWAAWKLTVYGQQLATIGKLVGKGNMYVY